MTKIKDIFEKYHKRLDYLDLELILAKALKKDRVFVISHPEYNLRKMLEQKAEKYIKRRLKHEPLAYILGRKEFFGFEFTVNHHTLIPRPETELLVEKALEHIKSNPIKNRVVIDVGTGSGNIIISIAKSIPNHKFNKDIEFIATDISDGALRVAKKNSTHHCISKKIKLVRSNLLSGLKYYLLKNYFREIIFISNLPYLSKSIYQKTSLDIKKYEPQSALISGKHGLAHYEKLFNKIYDIKNMLPETNIFILIEFSPEQKSALDHLLKKIFSRNKSFFHKDYSGRFRVMSGQL